MTTAKGPRTPRAVGLAGVGTGTQAALWLATPHLAVAITLIEATLVITVILTALYAADKYSARAFRLLPWPTNETAERSTLGIIPESAHQGPTQTAE
jgi:hypothetical protein